MDPSEAGFTTAERGCSEASVLVRRAAGELGDLRRAAALLEERLSSLAPLARAHDPSLLTSLQALDRIRQAAEGLEGFLERLAGALPAGLVTQMEPLVADIDLREVADRLRGRAAASEEPGRPTGEVDLF